MRTWEALIEVHDNKEGWTTQLEATRSEWDLLRDQTSAAVNEAWNLGIVNDRYDVTVIMMKRTKARGLEVDRTFRPFLDRRGRLSYSR